MISLVILVIGVNSYTMFDGKEFLDSWALLNTAGTDIELQKNSTTNFLAATLRTWDTIRVQRSSPMQTGGQNFFSFEVYYVSDRVKTMRFRTRLFSEEYNQQTETELKPYDYIVKSGVATRVYVPLTIADEKGTLQTFSIQRIEVTDLPIDFKITTIDLQAEGVPTTNKDVVDVSDDSSANEKESKEAAPSLLVALVALLIALYF
ncbi:hypothetical protein EIN_079970 [Entamoeba invadens IP1]|uniref:hypothetical protein n=1 Tax=Entamoeba invadens IP1 TaxID=370355 RepID=UPI0002C3E5F9|nr:hypothetical protein EIN_079970 [Entamoeba invadens IP1]ELP85045.1 hypothetical protein EIN_079970 [Entamoeba invadens IP1]|eukprot:XP_004184391.1 hypothetical protein EIN_079970 [Entamoeba invadens IP1]